MISNPLALRAAALRLVAASIRAALPELARIVAQAPHAQRRIAAASDDNITVLGGGALLHAFYNELEKIFELIATQIDGFQPTGDDWHTRLADPSRAQEAECFTPFKTA